MIDDGKEIAIEARPPDSVVDVFGISIQQEVPPVTYLFF
jgi:hypothetical protein